ncbi:MAG: hypothetical protein ACLP78_00740 [Thermoplasmata archaeon]
MEPGETTTWRFLFGFYQLEEAVAIANAQGISYNPTELESLRGRISEAISAVSVLKSRAGVVPKIVDVPASYRDRLGKLETEPTFKELVTGMKSWAWKLVELGSLRTFQPSVNWGYVERLVKRAPKESDEASVLDFCLPLAGTGTPQRVVVSFNPTANTYSIVSEHLDLRIVGQVQGEDPTTKRRFFGFATGFGLPTITIAHYRDMYLVKNGYHRAVALLAAGHKRIPALVVEADTYQMTGAAGQGFFTIDVMSSPRPPFLSDFLSHAAVNITRPLLRTVLTIHGEGQALAL